MNIRFTVASTLVVTAGTYVGAGAAYLQYRASGPRPLPGEWPAVELQRLLDFLRTPEGIQQILAVERGQITGAYIHALELNPSKLSESVHFWLSNMHRAEVAGLIATAGAALMTFSVLFTVSKLSERRAKRAAQRNLKQKTAATRLGGARRRQIEVAGVPLPNKSETRGILLCGTPGAGKSQVLSRAIHTALERRNSVVAVDRGGELLSQLYRAGDVIFCPLDRRAPDWSLLVEARNDVDRDTLGDLLFPQRGDGSPGDFFQQAAGVVFKALLRVCADENNGALWTLLANKRELERTLSGTEAEQYIAAREWGGVYGNMMNALQWLKYLPPNSGQNAYSIRTFVAESDANPGRALWAVIPKRAASALNPMAALLVGLVAHETLSLEPSETRRVWLATDELGNLPMLHKFNEVLTEGRKHGLSPLSGLQNLAQLRQKYGRDGAQVLMSCYQTWLILRQGDAESAEAMSRHIGEREVKEWHRNEGHSSGEGRSSRNSGKSEHVRVKRTVLGTELKELPDLRGYLCISPYPAALVDIPLTNFKVATSSFEPSSVAPIPTTAVAVRPSAIPALDLGALDHEQDIEH